MRRNIALTMLFILAGPVWADGGSPFDENLARISWEDATSHFGERCIVYGTVVTARDIGSRCFLNFHQDFRNNFTVVINREDYVNFPDPPETTYNGQHVRVVGTVIEYRGKPEIIVSSPEDIEIIDDPTPPKTDGAPTPAAEPAAPKPTMVKVPPQPTVQWKPPADGVIRVATFNVLNLFDDYDDPYIKNEVLPGKPAEERERLAQAIRALNADVLALEEVENRPGLEQFVATRLSDMAYQEVALFSGNSNRGINVALLSRFPLGPVTSYRHLEFRDSNGKPLRFQRDLLHVRVQPERWRSFDVFVVHLKSKRGGPEVALPIRLGEAAAMRAVFDRILRDDPDAAFVVCGDFNDTIDSKPLQRIIGTGPTSLAAFVSELSSDEQVTLKKWGSMVDFIFASPAMGAAYRQGSYDVVTDHGDINGSDHNPVVAAFQLKAATRRD